MLAVKLVEGGEQRFDTRVGNGVPERLALPPVVDEAFVAHPGEVLRAGRLTCQHRAPDC